MAAVDDRARAQVRQDGRGPVWLDAAADVAFRFYQFWMNIDDRDVVSYLKFFTWLEQAEIERLARGVEVDPAGRGAQGGSPMR